MSMEQSSQEIQSNSGSKGNPKVTIGLMVRNEAEFLEETIKGILEQTFTDYRILISDNESTDRTEKIARQYANSDDRIIYHRQSKNIGALENYNWLVRNSDSDYFVLAGAHDVWPDNYLATLYAALEEDSSAVLSYAPTTWIDQSGNEVADKKTGFIDSSGYSEISRFNMYLWADQHALYGMCRREALLKTRLQLKIVGSGAVLLAELSLLGTFVVVPETRWQRRINRKPETREEALERYARSLLVSDRMHIFPHWRIPMAYFGSVVLSNVGFTKKVMLFLCVFNVFILRRNELTLDILDILKKLLKRNKQNS